MFERNRTSQKGYRETPFYFLCKNECEKDGTSCGAKKGVSTTGMMRSELQDEDLSRIKKTISFTLRGLRKSYRASVGSTSGCVRIDYGRCRVAHILSLCVDPSTCFR
jgi:hypothetical protein